MKSFGIFFVCSALTSVFHYLFQILLAKQMGESGFTAFAGEYAQVNFWMLTSTWAYYWFAFNPRFDRVFKSIFTLAHAIAAASFLLPPRFHGLSVLAVSVAHSMLTGVYLGRGDFFSLGALGIGAAMFKLPLLLYFAPSAPGPATVYLIIYGSFLLAQFFFIFFRPRPGSASPPITYGLWGTLLLSVATHSFSQGEVLWVDRFIPKSMGLAATLSLLGKGVFFAQLVLANWWLPRWSDAQKVLGKLALPVLVGGALLMSLVAGACLSIVFDWMLGWKELPSLGLYLLAALNATTLALTFQLLQLSVTRADFKSSLSLYLVPLAGWLSTGFIAPQLTNYYLVMAGLQLCLVAVFFPWLRVAE